MATASVSYSFTALGEAVASEVNTNFNDLVSFLNAQVVHKDGAVAMTGLLSLSGDPTADAHAVRKAYLDTMPGISLQQFSGNPDTAITADGSYQKVADIDITLPSGWTSCDVICLGGVNMRFNDANDLDPTNTIHHMSTRLHNGTSQMQSWVMYHPMPEGLVDADVISSAPIFGIKTALTGTENWDLEAGSTNEDTATPEVKCFSYDMVALKIRRD